jgi:hypothetical protein
VTCSQALALLHTTRETRILTSFANLVTAGASSGLLLETITNNKQRMRTVSASVHFCNSTFVRIIFQCNCKEWETGSCQMRSNKHIAVFLKTDLTILNDTLWRPSPYINMHKEYVRKDQSTGARGPNVECQFPSKRLD